MTVYLNSTSRLTGVQTIRFCFSWVVTGTHTVYWNFSSRMTRLHSRTSTSWSFQTCLATFTLRSSYCTGAGATGAAHGVAHGLPQPLLQLLSQQPPRERRQSPFASLIGANP